jgi:hypothetical protein
MFHLLDTETISAILKNFDWPFLGKSMLVCKQFKNTICSDSFIFIKYKHVLSEKYSWNEFISTQQNIAAISQIMSKLIFPSSITEDPLFSGKGWEMRTIDKYICVDSYEFRGSEWTEEWLDPDSEEFGEKVMFSSCHIFDQNCNLVSTDTKQGQQFISNKYLLIQASDDELKFDKYELINGIYQNKKLIQPDFVFDKNLKSFYVMGITDDHIFVQIWNTNGETKTNTLIFSMDDASLINILKLPYAEHFFCYKKYMIITHDLFSAISIFTFPPHERGDGNNIISFDKNTNAPPKIFCAHNTKFCYPYVVYIDCTKRINIYNLESKHKFRFRTKLPRKIIWEEALLHDNILVLIFLSYVNKVQQILIYFYDLKAKELVKNLMISVSARDVKFVISNGFLFVAYNNNDILELKSFPFMNILPK